MRGAKEDTYRLKAIFRKPIAQVYSIALNASKLAKYPDERLKEVSAGTVIREFVYFCPILNHARTEWRINIQKILRTIKDE